MPTKPATHEQTAQAKIAARAIFSASNDPIPYRIARRVATMILGERPSHERNMLARAIEIDLVLWRDARKEWASIAGKADCGCWHHAEEGVPCEHDIALAASGAAA